MRVVGDLITHLRSITIVQVVQRVAVLVQTAVETCVCVFNTISFIPLYFLSSTAPPDGFIE